MNRPSLQPVVQPIPQWQTIYCSLMLLLVVFFVMLIAYSAIDKERLPQMKIVTSQAPAASSLSRDMNQAMQSLMRLSVTEGIKGGFSVVRTQDGFKAVVTNPVLFASGELSLGKDAYPILDGIIKIAQRNRLSIEVAGHTDNIPIHTQKFPSNWELSTMRAVNILRYLQLNGIPAARLAAVGFAEHRPTADNDTPEGRQKNRRIEILFKAVR
jgi:chemotaxis protein MotB